MTDPNPAEPTGEPAYTAVQLQAINNFSTVGKLSDFVRDLGKFDGRPTELISWITDVEGIFDLYRDLPETSVEYGVLTRSIRRKIIGEASDVLNANNVFHNWDDIKRTLLLYYKDKRDVQTLDYELTTIKKAPSESLSSYFSRVNELLALLIVQVQTDDCMVDAAASHINYFRRKALDSFIRGLEKPLSILLKTADVKTLSKAYQFCLEYKNIDIRSAPFRNEHTNYPVPKPRGLELSQQRPIPHVPMQPRIRAPPTPMPRTFSQNYRPPVYQPQPMDVDHSVRSSNINYGNRPTQQFRPNNQVFQKPIAMMKRPHPPSSQHHVFKRQAHPVEQDQDYLDNLPEFYYTDGSYNYSEDNFHYHDDCSEQQTQNLNPVSQEDTEVNSNSLPSGSDCSTNFLEMIPGSSPGW